MNFDVYVFLCLRCIELVPFSLLTFCFLYRERLLENVYTYFMMKMSVYVDCSCVCEYCVPFHCVFGRFQVVAVQQNCLFC